MDLDENSLDSEPQRVVNAAVDDGSSEEEHDFDISLAASHVYMGGGLMTVRGRVILDAGWHGCVPVVAHHGTVFPGETVPMLVPNADDAALLTQTIKEDKLFGLLCPDESGAMVSGFGVLCEVFEAGMGGDPEPTALTFKARATHRFRLLNIPQSSLPIHFYSRMRFAEIFVLPEMCVQEPLRASRLESLRMHKQLRFMDAAVTPWPLFLYDMFDYERMRTIIQDYFSTIMLDKLPEEPVSLSFWVASNLTLSARDRLTLFVVDNALLRLHMEVAFISKFSRVSRCALCCSSCGEEVARRDHVFPMSSHGVHSNYTNLGGFMHDIMTVSVATNISLSGRASTEFSWFPGYSWTIALCADCKAHVGWRFNALKKNLRPQQFYGLCRNYVQPRSYDQDPVDD